MAPGGCTPEGRARRFRPNATPGGLVYLALPNHLVEALGANCGSAQSVWRGPPAGAGEAHGLFSRRGAQQPVVVHLRRSLVGDAARRRLWITRSPARGTMVDAHEQARRARPFSGDEEAGSVSGTPIAPACTATAPVPPTHGTRRLGGDSRNRRSQQACADKVRRGAPPHQHVRTVREVDGHVCRFGRHPRPG